MFTIKQFWFFFFKLVTEKKNLLCLSLITILFFLDRFSKIKIVEKLINQNNIYINDFINLSLVWNTGVGFGLLSSNSNYIYNSITTLIGLIIIFLFYLIFKSKLLDKLLFSLVIGGALGNFYDRLVFMAVPDFIDIHYETFHWFTFNIADIFITLGVIMLIIKELMIKNGKNI
tara:strand:+ start:5027 stop:5545 length:519 start_codon:yes stop_codon:yes gene_type:complete